MLGLFKYDKLLGLFKGSSNEVQCELQTYTLMLDLSFEANVQVAYKDETDRLRLKRFNGREWQATLQLCTFPSYELRFKAFVYCPNLEDDQQLTLSIYAGDELLEKADFKVPKEQDYSGWFSLPYVFDK